MKIVFQGVETETACTDLEMLLQEQGYPKKNLLVELNDEIFCTDLTQKEHLLSEGDRINLFRIVAGG